MELILRLVITSLCGGHTATRGGALLCFTGNVSRRSYKNKLWAFLPSSARIIQGNILGLVASLTHQVKQTTDAL